MVRRKRNRSVSFKKIVEVNRVNLKHVKNVMSSTQLNLFLFFLNSSTAYCSYLRTVKELYTKYITGITIP